MKDLSRGGVDVQWYLQWIVQNSQGVDLASLRDVTVGQIQSLFGKLPQPRHGGVPPAPTFSTREQALAHWYGLRGEPREIALRLAKKHAAEEKKAKRYLPDPVSL